MIHLKKFTDKINESVEDTIPTAVEFLSKNIDYVLENDCKDDVETAMIEFAKLHVRAAVKEQIRIENDRATEDQIDILTDEALQRTYPLENIK